MSPCFLSLRLIKHTKQLLEENEEKLCIKVLQTLREMMTKDRGYGEKVLHFIVLFKSCCVLNLRFGSAWKPLSYWLAVYLFFKFSSPVQNDS